jgi:glycosyltransferase involved in cell wall biosynthesis
MIKESKVLIILVYYNRPSIVLNALESIQELNYENFEVHLIDDGSEFKGQEVVEKHFPSLLNKFSFKYIEDTVETKKQRGGSVFGNYINQKIKESDSDIVITLCDDDALFPNYLNDLNMFFNKNPNEMWCYCYVKFYNPEKNHYKTATEKPDNPTFNTSTLNSHTGKIIPSCRVDSSQVAFRRYAFIKGNVWFPYPQTADLDRYVFERMVTKWGLCPFLGTYGQYKGWFENQLGVKIKNRKEMY